MPRPFLPCLLVLALLAPAVSADTWTEGPRNAPHLEPAFPQQTRAPQIDSGIDLAVETLAGGLENPWGIAVLPDGTLLVTERSGTLNHVTAQGEVRAISGTPEVFAQRQGGLLDVAVAPDFDLSRTIYLTYAKPMGDGLSATAAARAELSAEHDALTGLRDIFVQDPPSPTPVHYGSRIVPDGELVFVTTGEHSTSDERVLAQDMAATYGKVVRLTPDGAIPQDNPFVGQPGADEAVWTLGHRNVQGAALRPGTDQLWTLEHGPMGGDELNLIEKGANYGWPNVSYGVNYGGTGVGSGLARGPGYAEPVYFWDPVIAPGGLTFYDGAMFPEWRGDILAASLNPGGLVRLRIEGDRVVGEERFLVGKMRIRDVAVAADGAILLAVDDSDGRILRLTRAAN